MRPLLLLFLGACSSSTLTSPAPSAQPIDSDIPHGAQVVGFVPGRFSSVSNVRSEGGCSQTSVSGWSRSSVVMTFELGGGVSACRGLHEQSIYMSAPGSDDRGRPPDVEEGQEQQGLRGRWTKRGAWIDVTLGLDDTVCPRVRAGRSSFADREWQLECLSMKLAGIAAPSVACRFPDEPHSSPFYGVSGLIGEPYEDRHWIVVASGNGALLDGRDSWGLAGAGGVRASITDAPAKVELDAWSRSSP